MAGRRAARLPRQITPNTPVKSDSRTLRRVASPCSASALTRPTARPMRAMMPMGSKRPCRRRSMTMAVTGKMETEGGDGEDGDGGQGHGVGADVGPQQRVADQRQDPGDEQPGRQLTEAG